MLAVTALGFILSGAATFMGFARLVADYNAARLVRKEAAVARSLGFALRGVVGDTVEATSLSWTVMPGTFANRIVEIEAVQGLPIAVYRLDGSLFVTSSVNRPDEAGFQTEVNPEVLIALAQGQERLEVPVGNGDFLAYWYQLNSAAVRWPWWPCVTRRGAWKARDGRSSFETWARCSPWCLLPLWPWRSC